MSTFAAAFDWQDSRGGMQMMRLTSILKQRRLLALLAGVSVALAAGCTRPLYPIETVVTAQSCVNDARAIRFLVDANLSGITWDGGSANIVGDPTITDLGSGLVEVVAELDSVPAGDEVTLRFSQFGPFPFVAQVYDIGFFTVPPPGLPATPNCTPGDMPMFALSNDIHIGLKLEVSNPSPQPMTLGLLELAEVPGLLPGSQLDWSDPAFAAVPWQEAVLPGTPLDSQAPPLVVDLPDQVGPTTNGTLLRFIALVGGQELRGIVQVDLNGVVAVRPTTWGDLKAKYRN